MAGSHSCLYVHFVFSTKNRQPWLEYSKADQIHKYIAQHINEEFGHTLAIDGMCDHIHILADLKRDVAPAVLIREVKSHSSKWFKEKFDSLFSWQGGYGAFSVSKSAVPDVGEYIRNQIQHHQKFGFEEEFLAFLDKHEVEYDPKYVLD